eukprot:scaffold63087_cov22-Tisochrysis_lutea.AAC.1
MLAKQNLLSGHLNLGGWAVQRAILLGTTFMFRTKEEADVSRDSARPPRAHGTAPEQHGCQCWCMQQVP